MLHLRTLSAAGAFLAPFAVLLIAWAVLVPLFDVNPRIFPHLTAVLQAGLESIQDGTLFTHIWASLVRVAVGTVLALVAAIPLGIAMGVSPVVSSFLTPLFRLLSVLAGIAWIPIATLWFGYGFGAITFVIFNAVFFIVTDNTLLGVSTIPRPMRNAAWSLGAGRWAMLTARGLILRQAQDKDLSHIKKPSYFLSAAKRGRGKGPAFAKASAGVPAVALAEAGRVRWCCRAHIVK